jgi:GNAT superfamily N-acetyltransferase
MINNLIIRDASIDDATTILSFIKKIAEYEKLEKDVSATVGIIQESIFRKNFAQVVIGEVFERAVAFAVFFYTFSTFTGKPSLYIEDIFVDEEYRHRGVGSKIFKHLTSLAIKNGCGRLELSVLKWNEPAIKFYKKMGGYSLDEWSIFRFDEEVLKNIINDL